MSFEMNVSDAFQKARSRGKVRECNTCKTQILRDFSNTTPTAPVSGYAALRPPVPPSSPRSSAALSASSTTTLSAGASDRNRQLLVTR